MTNEEFILQNRNADVRALAFKQMPEGVDPTWCLQQIEGFQLAQKKLPRWAQAKGIWFPPRLSLEQCSSELTATYKHDLAIRLLAQPDDRKRIIDFTGGFGVDFSYLAAAFKQATYIERLPHLCDIARHNFPLLGLAEAQVVCAETNDAFEFLTADCSLAYLDPARRDNVGRKVVAISDCTPDLTQLQDKLSEHCQYVMVKFSPMLDITQALRSVRNVCEVHVVSVKGECKELLLVIAGKQSQPFESEAEPVFFCSNLDTNEDSFSFKATEIRGVLPDITPKPLTFLYEPNASILKANAQDSLAARLALQKIHPQSNLFFSDRLMENYPGRVFRVVDSSDFGKKNLKRLLANVSQANLTIRNFPSTVADLRKKLKLREGGDIYLFATTLADGSHALIKCQK